MLGLIVCLSDKVIFRAIHNHVLNLAARLLLCPVLTEWVLSAQLTLIETALLIQ
jgi:hypothetical protein